MVTLKGDPSLGSSGISLKAMIRSLQKEKRGLLVELKKIDGKGEVAPQEEEHSLPSEMQELLKSYEKVFNMPPRLPPSRQYEHSITLKKGTNPMSMRPYRYPQFQKDEIKRLIKEILFAGII